MIRTKPSCRSFSLINRTIIRIRWSIQHHTTYLGTCVRYDTSLLYFSCVSSIWGLSGKVNIGHSRHVPPVRNASRSRSKSAVDRTLKEVSWSTWSKWTSRSSIDEQLAEKKFNHLRKNKIRTIHVVYRDSFEEDDEYELLAFDNVRQTKLSDYVCLNRRRRRMFTQENK